MKKAKAIIVFLLLHVITTVVAQPIIAIGINRDAIKQYMDCENGCRRLSYSKTEATYLMPGLMSEPDTITYHFQQKWGVTYTCTRVTIRPVDVDSLIAEKLRTHRFVKEPYGYSLYTGYVNDDVIMVLRKGKTLELKNNNSK